MKNPFPDLYLTRLILTLRIESELWLPAYKGFTFRGGLGDALLALTCSCDVKNRAPYTHSAACRYQDIFKTRLHDKDMQNAMAVGQNVPAPILVNPPETTRRRIREGEVLTCEVLMVGRASAYWMYIIEAFRLLGNELGIGAEHTKFTVLHVYDGLGDTLYSLELGLGPTGPSVFTSNDMLQRAPRRRLQLHFLTPTYLRTRGENEKAESVRPRSFRSGQDLERAYWPLVQRIHTLTHCYCSDTPLDKFFEDRYRHDTRGIQLKENGLNWIKSGNHYSRVQNNKQRIEGFQGHLSFAGSIGPFIPYFQLGQHLNIGKSTISGLGRFELLS